MVSDNLLGTIRGDHFSVCCMLLVMIGGGAHRIKLPGLIGWIFRASSRIDMSGGIKRFLVGGVFFE